MRFMSNQDRQFVLLHHFQSNSEHWDLMLDLGNALATWQLLEHPVPPIRRGALRGVPARRIADHRRLYLHREGPISGARGHVKRLDRGSYILIEQRLSCWIVQVEGDLLAGTYRLPAGAGLGEMRPISPDMPMI